MHSSHNIVEEILEYKIIYIKNRIKKIEERKNEKIIEYGIGIDPAFGGESEVGIILGGKLSNEIIILGDFSGYYKPEVWIYYVQKLAMAFDCIISIEINHGGQLLTSLFSGFAVYPQRALTSKYERALQCYLLYKQRKVLHLDYFVKLEEQMLFFKTKKKDRVDALVWLLNYFNQNSYNLNIDLI